MKIHTLIVLNDGETYSSVEGASIIVVDNDTMEAIHDMDISIRNVNPIIEIGLKDFSPNSVVINNRCEV